MVKSKSTDLHLYLRLLEYVRPYWRVFGISILAMVMLAVTNPATAALFKYMIEGVFLTQDADKVSQIIVALVLLSVIAAIANYVSGLSLHWVANKVIMDLRGLLFARLLTFPSRFYDHQTSGSLISKFTFDVTQIKEASTNVLNVLVRDSLTIVGLLGWMLFIDWEMTMITLITAPAIAGFLLIIRRRLRRMSRNVQDSMGDIHHILGEVINGERIVKLYGGQQQEQERFQKAINNNRRYSMKFSSAAIASSPLVQLVTALALAAIIYLSAQKAAAGSIRVDDFVSFFTAILMILGPLKRLVRINEHIQRGLAASESVFALLDEPAEEDNGSKILTGLEGKIEIIDLSFSYDNSDVKALRNISLVINAGETVAFVGISGSGKSTLANLLPRFYQHTEGKILLDGHDIRDLPLSQLRQYIALVSQDIVLFNDTIKHNIAYGRSEASDEEVIKAAERAHAMEFIAKLPAGLDATIGDKGSKLSGGQRQRIAMARALLKDSPILILDEATSALDTESERAIQLALDEVRKDRTCLIIAHRLSTIENADRVIVIENSRIVESGSHMELLNRNGAYAKLYMSNDE
ncbi:MAG: subfamily B ATP-binding cassette protein MsbA [Gammaproteobacteria bacterium]|jgi:subfamily B ATP-binding cassette protein MsbA